MPTKPFITGYLKELMHAIKLPDLVKFKALKILTVFTKKISPRPIGHNPLETNNLANPPWQSNPTPGNDRIDTFSLFAKIQFCSPTPPPEMTGLIPKCRYMNQRIAKRPTPPPEMTGLIPPQQGSASPENVSNPTPGNDRIDTAKIGPTNSIPESNPTPGNDRIDTPSVIDVIERICPTPPPEMTGLIPSWMFGLNVAPRSNPTPGNDRIDTSRSRRLGNSRTSNPTPGNDRIDTENEKVLQ